jgi:DNA invertase Pin-like site-specific DNA recombinase
LIYEEKISGKDARRPELQRMLTKLRPGDVVIVTQLDRLARSVIDLLTILEKIASEGAAFQSLAEPWVDTTTPMDKLVITILAGVAEFERKLILSRCNEGRETAKRAGRSLGRPAALSTGLIEMALEKIAAGERVADVAERFGVSPVTIYRMARKHKATAHPHSAG